VLECLSMQSRLSSAIVAILVLNNSMQYSAVQCSTSAVQYSTVQCSTVQCSTVQMRAAQWHTSRVSVSRMLSLLTSRWMMAGVEKECRVLPGPAPPRERSPPAPRSSGGASAHLGWQDHPVSGTRSRRIREGFRMGHLRGPPASQGARHRAAQGKSRERKAYSWSYASSCLE